jgi:hypothetical protein
MIEKPRTAAGYGKGQVDLVRQTCLYVATKLGDQLDVVVVVGGLVPALLIPPAELPPGAQAYVGTMDLDLGFSLGILDKNAYQAISARLREAGLSPDTNERNRPTSQRWAIRDPVTVTIDFLIAPTAGADEGGKLRNLEPDFAAIVTRGLPLAFIDREIVTLDGHTIRGERATRQMPVCGPGAFVVLKAQAFRDRGTNKDAYDLFYLLRNYQNGPRAVAARLKPLLARPEAEGTLNILREDFGEHDSLGPKRVAEFLYDRDDDETQADVVGAVRALIDECGDHESP